MKLDNMFKKTRQTAAERSGLRSRRARPEIPQGLLRKCGMCGSAIIAEDARNNHYICPKCRGYFHMPARRRISMIADPDSFVEWEQGMETVNPMEYRGYEEKLEGVREKTGLEEAILIGEARIRGMRTVLGACDGRFLMASMGEVVGEKITRSVERAIRERLPVILFICSGGARMQEGIVSLMQMAKTAAAFKRFGEAGLPYISVLTDPTTGGVTASFAMLGDIILAEPGALIGFAGPRVIEQTIRQKLPKGFQRSEFLLEHGFLDGIVERAEQRETLARILRLHGRKSEKSKMTEIRMPEAQAAEVKELGNAAVAQAAGKMVEAQTAGKAAGTKVRKKEVNFEKVYRNYESEAGQKRTNLPNADKTGDGRNKLKESTRKFRDPWERVLISRKKNRPVGSDYIRELFEDFTELHGDRCFADDQAVIGGIAFFEGMPVTVIVQEKGSSTKENILRNFGMPCPEGYRKALRLMKQAEKFHRPVICFVDTPGAFCGLEAEERGQGEAIARSIYEMSGLSVPILSVVIGEGGSGGALAMATADEVWMLENAIYSVLSPEGFASILWKDSSRAQEAARVMKLTADELLQRRIVEKVLPEPDQFTTETLDQVTAPMKKSIVCFLEQYRKLDPETLREHRYMRFRRL